MEKRKKKQLKIFSAIAFVLIFLGLLVFLFSGDNFVLLQELFKDDVTKEEIRETLSRLGIKGYFTIGILSMLQVVISFLPAEPVQVFAGISFGLWKGGLLCFAGVFVGNTVIYLLYKIYGDRLSEFFEKNVELDFEAVGKSPKITLIVFILYFLPAIPYGLICFFTASMDIKYPRYILLTCLGSIPSIIIGVGLGHLAIASSWILSVCVFAVLVALLVVLYKNKAKVFAAVNAYVKKKSEPYSSKTVVEKHKPLLFNIMLPLVSLWFGTQLKIKLKNNVGDFDRSALVLCNHGAATDFFFLAKLTKKNKPRIITARLYLYHKWLGTLLRRLGCFPKSMFASDLENARNCMRVIKNGETLAMMPEARLSTIGKFEGIQDATYRFLQKAGLPIYTIRLNGSYFSNPKWGNGIRKGSLVEGSLEFLCTAEEAKEMDAEVFQEKVNAALTYDEFAWLKNNPNLRYKSKKLAEGLENILSICPECGAEFSLRTKGREIYCEKCGFKRLVDSRYAFTDVEPFENFAEWYEWQKSETEKRMLENPEFALQSPVTLKHSSKDGKTMLREAGQGVCRLDKSGLTYRGTRDGEQIEKHFPLSEIYRLLFGAGVDFEIYEGSEIWFFVPENTRSCVAWYYTSELLKKHYS